MKLPIEEIREKAGTKQLRRMVEPFDTLVEHEHNTHQMLLDALKLAESALVDLGACPDSNCDCPRALPKVVEAIKAASYVEVTDE